MISTSNQTRPLSHADGMIGIPVADIPVSEAEPVRIMAKAHQKRRESQFDMHFGLELGIVISGVMRRYYQGYQRVVRRGELWFCGMWEPHGFEVVRRPCQVIVLVIWPPFLAQQRFEEAPQLRWMTPFTLRPPARPQIAAAKRKIFLEQVRQLTSLLAASTPLERIRIRLCLLNILALVLDDCRASRAETNEPGREHWRQLNRAAQLVFESRTFISTRRAAQASGLNRNVFSRRFAAWMGIRFAEFALRFRLKQAADRLLSQHDPVKAVARQWGFVDISHFSRVFRKYYGLAPAAFRRLGPASPAKN